jgi:hypothetical protein
MTSTYYAEKNWDPERKQQIQKLTLRRKTQGRESPEKRFDGKVRRTKSKDGVKVGFGCGMGRER